MATSLADSVGVALLLVVLLLPSSAQVSVLTHHNDNARTGQNLNETYLTPSVVNTTHFGELFTQPVDGLVVAQPLYMSNLQINGATHNVVFIATMHDSVYAFDADSNTGSNASPLWHTSFIDPPSVTPVPIADQGCTASGFTEVGILGTPVIDSVNNIMYLVAKTKENGNYVHRLHALDLATGQEKFGESMVIEASYLSNGNPVTFTDQHRMQRPALLLSNGVLYIGFGTMGCKQHPPSTGWMMAYSASSSLQQLALLDVGPTQSAVPGIWMGGDGPAVDSSGDVYMATGDGLFDYNTGGLDYGNTLMRLRFAGGSFALADYFSPHNQADLTSNDLDLGSSGPVLLPDQTGTYPHLAVIAGKAGTIYLVNRDNLGQYNSVDQVVQEVIFDPDAEPDTEVEIDGGATYWNNLVYFAVRGYPVKAFSLTNGQLSTSPVATTSKVYKHTSLFSLSANGQTNGILWGVVEKATTSFLDAFQATNLKVLYTSSQNLARDPLHVTSHFVLPTVANGKVYVGTTDNVTVMGLFPNIKATAGNNQTGAAGTKLSRALRVTVTDAYTGSPIPGVTINYSDGGSGGSFTVLSPVTDSQGTAATRYTLPDEPGVYKVTASSPGFVTATFTATATE
ncbi:MAG: carboxypeptidase-like regulatory domain-containing protein [Terriglobales bacterium]